MLLHALAALTTLSKAQRPGSTLPAQANSPLSSACRAGGRGGMDVSQDVQLPTGTEQHAGSTAQAATELPQQQTRRGGQRSGRRRAVAAAHSAAAASGLAATPSGGHLDRYGVVAGQLYRFMFEWEACGGERAHICLAMQLGRGLSGAAHHQLNAASARRGLQAAAPSL